MIKVTKKQKTDLKTLLKTQILIFATLHDIFLNKNELDVLVFIVVNGYDKSTLKQIVDAKIYKSEQCVRNCRGKMVKLNLLTKGYQINPELELFTTDTLYELKLLYVKEESGYSK